MTLFSRIFMKIKKPFRHQPVYVSKVSQDQHNIHKHLIDKCQQGDAYAQEQIYKLYAGAMYAICCRILGSEEDAQDILQESFMDVFHKLPELRETSFFSAWIKRVVTNNCINSLRKKRLITSELEDNWDAEIDETDDYDYQKYQLEQVRESLGLLPDGCRTVLSLYVFEGYDHKEIGEILKISESASKAQYCKAKAKIRKLLNETGVRNAG